MSGDTPSPDDLTSVVDEYICAAGAFTRHLLYPQAGLFSAVLPDSFHEWVSRRPSTAMIEDARILHDQLHRAAQGLVLEASVSPERKPSPDAYDRFIQCYRDFLLKLRQLEGQGLRARAGIDPATGLRDHTILQEDLGKELEQLSRRGGKQFCLILARLDNYADIASRVTASQKDKVAHELGGLVSECLRSFDDAYRISESEFVMLLRQTDRTGAAAAIKRLQKLLKENPISYNVEGINVLISVSSCSAEPVPGQNMEELLVNMRADLEHMQSSSSAVLQYRDQSLLQRYIQENAETK